MALPTAAQVALALVIAKSKPIDVSFEEYFSQLREIIVDEPRKCSLKDQHYIDGVLFWKRAYEKSESQRTALENRVFELENQLRTRPNPSVEAEGAAVSQKRKHGDSESKQSAKANTQSKRRAVEYRVLANPVDMDLDFSGSEIPSSCRTLLRCLFNLNRLNEREQIVCESHFQLIRTLCHAATCTVKDICRTQQAVLPPNTVPLRLEDVFKVVEHVWRRILLTLNEMTEPVKSAKNSSLPCMPQMVALFQTMLGQLHQSSLDEADCRLRKTNSKGVKHRSAPASASQQLQDINIHKARCKLIAFTLSSMLLDLDHNKEIHFRIFEGLVCVLLDHIGSSVSLMVFANHRSQKPPEPGLLPPRGLLDVSHIETDIAVKTTTIAAPYLIYVLRNAFAVGKSFSKLSSSDIARQDGFNAPTTNLLSSSVEARFQETLLRGVYGDNEGDFNLAFMRSNEPSSTDTVEWDKSISQTEDNPDWFASQVWEHVGWDILVKKLGASLANPVG